MELLEPSPSSAAATSSHQLVARLRSCELRLDALQMESAASGAAATDFAAEAMQRLAGLEANQRSIPTFLRTDRGTASNAASFGSGGLKIAQQGVAAADDNAEELLAKATSGLLEDVSGCARRLFASVSAEVLQANELTKLAAVAAAERVVAEHAAQAATDINHQFAKLRAQLCNGEALTSAPTWPALSSTVDGDLDNSSLSILAETRQASAQATAAEARIAAKISQCVNLIDACSPANRPGLEALRDVVESLESVSTRLTVLESGAVRAGLATEIALVTPGSPDSPLLASGECSPAALLVAGRLGACSPRALRGLEAHFSARVDGRLDKLEQSLPAMHDRLHESMLVLWSAVREISRELVATGVGGGVCLPSGGSSSRAAAVAPRNGSPQRSPRLGAGVFGRRNDNMPLPAFREVHGQRRGGTNPII